jgi:hypothetical protein
MYWQIAASIKLFLLLVLHQFDKRFGPSFNASSAETVGSHVIFEAGKCGTSKSLSAPPTIALPTLI